jgi:hypothetical protein
MTKHPTSEWEWEDTAEVAFQKWFHDLYGGFSLRSEHFFGDCEVEDVNTRKDLMTKWLHSAFLTGYNTGRCSKTMTEYQPTPQTPEQVAQGLRDVMKQAKKDGVFDVVDEPDWYDEVEWDEKDNPTSYITDEVVNRLMEKYQSQKLWNILKDKWGFSEDACGDIVEAVAEWLPKEQSAAGSQNVDTELLVDGFNDCLRKMKEMLR